MAGRRSGRAAAKRAAAALESTPKTWQALDDDDEPMPDVEPESKSQPEPEDEAKDEDAEDEAEEEEAPEEEESAKSPTPPPEPVIRRKRLGRPPKNKPPDWDLGVETPARDSDSTPRKRGRGGWRGRGGRKSGAPPPNTQQKVDKEGTMMDIVNDEVDIPEDPQGETKVDKLGNLQGDREYRCRTFTVLGRGDRLYMLSTEPARCVGFRDSYLFFTKHMKLLKIIVQDDEKRDMIEREIIPHSYKGRSIGIVTARSVFREFGALIVVGGRRIIDDYDIARAKEEGAVEGELADPNDKFIPGEPYNKNQYVAWHGASAVYHTSAPAVPAQTGKVESKKRRVAVTDVNWMLEHAREASIFNSQINALRRQNLNGVYDIHTNTMQYPANMQPTHARIVQVPPTDPESAEESSSQVFPQLKPSVPRNFMVTDTYLKTPSTGIAPSTFEGPDHSIATEQKAAGGDFLAPFRGLSAISEEIKNELPPECRKAFDEALAEEKAWHAKWATEKESKSRRVATIDKAIVPYSMMQ